MFFVHIFGNRSAVTFLLPFEKVIRTRARHVIPVRQPDISLFLDSLHLLPLEVRFCAKQPRDTDNCDQKQYRLDNALSCIKLHAWIYATGGQEHVDQHVQQRRWGNRGLGPVNGPLVQDAHHEVSEDRLQEQHLRNEVGVEITGPFESQMIWHLEAKGKSHLDLA